MVGSRLLVCVWLSYLHGWNDVGIMFHRSYEVFLVEARISQSVSLTVCGFMGCLQIGGRDIHGAPDYVHTAHVPLTTLVDIEIH